MSNPFDKVKKKEDQLAIIAADIKNSIENKVESQPLVVMNKTEFDETLKNKEKTTLEKFKLKESKVKKEKPAYQTIVVSKEYYIDVFIKAKKEGVFIADLTKHFFDKLSNNKDYFKEIINEIKEQK